MAHKRIGEVAALVGVPTHVLRHWEDMGVLAPVRLASGHRAYDAEMIARARLIRLCQGAGMSLATIRELYHADDRNRARMVREHSAVISDRIRQLNRVQEFLQHTLGCRHPAVSTCPECSGFADEGGKAGSGS